MAETTLDIISTGNKFPTDEQKLRFAKYRLNESRFCGTYGKNTKLIIKKGTAREAIMPYNVLRINKFKVYTNKMDSLLFNDDPIIRTGDIQRDKLITKLIDKTNWLQQIRKAVKYVEIYGDAYIKTYADGCSAIHPYNAFTVVDEYDNDNIIAFVLFDYLRDDKNSVYAVRFEAHTKNGIVEKVFKTDGLSLGESITCKYRGRTINSNGNIYTHGCNEFMVQKISVDSIDGVYGISPYEDFADLLHEIERRQTINIKILDAHSEPTVAVSAGILRENELTGEVDSDIMGSVIEVPTNGTIPQYITWDGKLENSNNLIDMLFSEIYEVTELGKTFMTGEYSGNISEESLDTLVKSAIDRGKRHVNEVWYELKKSLYVLCRLNGINITIDELNIIFKVGTVTSDKETSDIINSRVSNGTLSLKTALMQYNYFTDEQATKEVDNIRKESINDKVV